MNSISFEPVVTFSIFRLSFFQQQAVLAVVSKASNEVDSEGRS